MKWLYKIEYRQKFRGGTWMDYSNTVAIKGDAANAAARMTRIAMDEVADGNACVGVEIVSVNRIAKIDY